MLHIIINPATGAGRGDRIFRTAESVFRETGTAYRVYHSGRKKGIGDIISGLSGKLKDMPDGDFLDIVIIGGDGSMNEAVNSVVDFERTRIGFIPAGSGNDLARALGLEKDIRKLARRIASARCVRLADIGAAEINGKEYLFNISSGLGFDAETCFRTDRSGAKVVLNRIGLGNLVYITVALGLIIRNKRFRCRIELKDGSKRVYNECLFAVGMNRRYEGGGFMFCPEAVDDDGLLDFCVADRVGSVKFLRMFPLAFNGRHVMYPEVDIFRAGEVTITTDRPCHIHTDGEASVVGRKLKLSVSGKKLMMLD